MTFTRPVLLCLTAMAVAIPVAGCGDDDDGSDPVAAPELTVPSGDIPGAPTGDGGASGASGATGPTGTAGSTSTGTATPVAPPPVAAAPPPPPPPVAPPQGTGGQPAPGGNNTGGQSQGQQFEQFCQQNPGACQ